MPQMAPMNWLILFLIIMTTLILMMKLLFFFFIKFNKKIKSFNFFKKKNYNKLI